ncbi:MAG: hypothetical protein FWC62_00225, partial [Firmicutes bacterium]|nr:hypothetical protein [Bacillota bacterium]
MDFTIERGVAKSPKGIPKSPRWFIDNRVSFSYDSLGVVQVLYYQNRRVTFTPTIFLRKLRGGFRCYLNDNGVMYNPTYENVRVWPFGMESDFNHKGHKMTFEVLALDDSIVFRLIAPETLPEGMSLRMEFFHEFSLKCDNSDYRYSDNGYPRHWRYWTLDEAGDCLIGGYETDPTRADEKKTSGAASVDPVPEQMRDYEDYRVTLDNETPLPYEDSYGVGVCIAADFPYTFAQKSDGSDYLAARGKQILNGALRPGAAHSYVISFAEDAGGARLKARALAGRVNERIAAQFDRYGKVIENAPVLKSPYQGLNDYVAMAPLYHEALRMTERPGALRAKQDYFCWAWDTMTNSRSSLYWGDLRRVGDMLAFFHDASDPQKGLPHGFSYDFTPTYYYPLPAQGFYICILHQYIVFGGERERAEKYYPFARTLYLRMLTSEAGQTGLGSGLSLFPDFTRYMGENGHDLSSMNNTLLYCSSRAMEYLALYFGDRKTADTARAFFLRTEENYLKLFLDPDKNMVVSSVDSRDYKRRDCFSAGSVKWENNYLYDLLGPVMNGCLEVYKNGMVCEAG